MILLVAIALLAIVAALASLRIAANDGYRRLPTRRSDDLADEVVRGAYDPRLDGRGMTQM